MTEDKKRCSDVLGILSSIRSDAVKDCSCFKDGKVKGIMKSLALFTHRRVAKKQDPIEAENVIDHYGFQSCLNLAEICLFSAGIQLRTGSYISGGLDLRKAWKLYDKLLNVVDDATTISDTLKCGVLVSIICIIYIMRPNAIKRNVKCFTIISLVQVFFISSHPLFRQSFLT